MQRVKDRPVEQDELTIAEREAMLETVARIYVGMAGDLARLKNSRAVPARRKAPADRGPPDG